MRRVIAIVAALQLLACHVVARPAAAAPTPAARAGQRVVAAEDRGIVALDQALRDLTNPYTVMFVAAHPLDADYGTMAYYRKRLGARVVLLLATRGEAPDGLGWEAAPEPGVVRTRQTLEAARVVGADVQFLNLRDFGYSKTADEALAIWGHDDALGRVVRAIRLNRPDVMLVAGGSAGGGGQQAAVARLAAEGFEAAADASRFAGAEPAAWQVRRVFQAADESDGGVTTNLDEYDQIRGLTYAQIAAAAAGRHMRRAAVRAPSGKSSGKSYYKLLRATDSPDEKPAAGSPAAASVLNGLTLPENLSRSITPPRVGELSALEAIALREQLVEALKERLIEKRAEGAASELRERYGAEFFRVVRFTQSLERAIVLALGLSFDVALADSTVVPGQRLTARLTLRNGGGRALPVAFHMPASLAQPGGKPDYKASDVMNLGPGGATVKSVDYDVPKEAAVTLPHTARLHDEDYYAVAYASNGPPEPFGRPLLFLAEVGLDQAAIAIPTAVRYDVAPMVEISIEPPFRIARGWDKPRDAVLTATLRNRTPGPLSGALWVVPLALTEDDYEPVRVSFSREDERAEVTLALRLPVMKPPLDPNILIEFRREKPAPPEPLGFTTVTIRSGDFEVADGLKVGYVAGDGSWLRPALAQLGAEHAEVSLSLNGASASKPADQDSASPPPRACGNLAGFDTVIIDGDAYSARPELASFNRCLLDYVQQGGNLVVVSQRFDDWVSLVTFARLAPFPLKPSADRIVTESALVRVLDREHPLMSKPNSIDEKDFSGWVRPRALNVPREWAGEYVALLESSDPGEEPNKGGLLVARLGEGTYVYLSYALAPQLRAMNPGAYRLFANIVSLPKTVKQ
jgi:LmbE family N-acetylglucosaminyl deacetylase